MKFQMKSISKRNLTFGLATGILLGFSFPPFPLYYLIFAALVPYFLVLRQKESLAEINRFTYFTFFVFNFITLYWVGSWTKDADPFLMLSGVALLFFNPLLFLIPSSFYYFVKKNLNREIAFYSIPFFWVSYEYLYSVTEFRFPWLTLGNGVSYFTNYIQIADVIGVYGLSLLILFTNLFLTDLTEEFLNGKKFSKLKISAVLFLLIVPIVYGGFKLNKKYLSNGEIKVGLIQPDFNPWKKWEAGNLDKQLNIYLRLSKEAVKKGAKLIVWPETALPVYLLSGNYLFYVNKIRAFVDSANVFLVTGMPNAKFYKDSASAPLGAKKSEYGNYYFATYNSVLAFQPNTANVQQYGKIKLVPFGEKVPYSEYIPFFENLIKWNVGISSWNVGRDTTVFSLKSADGGKSLRVAPLICIESIYPDFTAQFVKKGAELISIVTNDSWYGNSSGPYQHKAFAALRAVENRRFVVRAANGGISCIIDENGRTLKQTEIFERCYLTGTVKILDAVTFYTNHPLLIPFAVLIVSAFLIILIFVRKIL